MAHPDDEYGEKDKKKYYKKDEKKGKKKETLYFLTMTNMIQLYMYTDTFIHHMLRNITSVSKHI